MGTTPMVKYTRHFIQIPFIYSDKNNIVSEFFFSSSKMLYTVSSLSLTFLWHLTFQKLSPPLVFIALCLSHDLLTSSQLSSLFSCPVCMSPQIQVSAPALPFQGFSLGGILLPSLLEDSEVNIPTSKCQASLQFPVSGCLLNVSSNSS